MEAISFYFRLFRKMLPMCSIGPADSIGASTLYYLLIILL